ncbi:MAG: 2-hydroxyacyl-CoA dehydratase family protein [Desulfobacterales bacterium]|jgi:benzoyl-CoA reductase/2-hydroxyglutaryl-CoA dehydratase subunit BcrC/BadD/HgdB|nr:2-hydroxyacyl-CoA dehydratase family protein [Desulfobacterales bacterium]
MTDKEGWSKLQKEKYDKTQPGEINFLESINKTQDYMAMYYGEGHRAKETGTNKISWITSSVPHELLFAFDVLPFLPEFSGVMASFEGKSTVYQEAAENFGYDIEVCSVARTNLGELILGRSKEEGALPAPDFLVATRHMCQTHLSWWEIYARHFNIPLYINELPYFQQKRNEPLQKHHEKYFVEGMKGLVRFLEKQTGKKFDIDKYREIVKLSNRAHDQWSEILEYGKITPAPYSDWDLYVPLMAMGNWRGLQMTVDLLDHILSEIRYRVENKIPALPNERFRLFFNGNPSWYNFQFVPAILAKRGGIFVASNTNYLFKDFSNIGSGSFEDIAIGTVQNYINQGLETKIEDTIQICTEHKVNGAIFQDNRGCRAFAFGFYDVMQALEDRLDIPTLVYESNSADLRFWSDEEISGKIEAYLDLLEQNLENA